MSLLRQLRHKSLNPQSLLPIAARFFASRRTPNFDSFPDEPTSAYYDDQVNAAGHSGDFEKLHYLLNKRAKDNCFTTNNTFNFVTAATASSAELGRTLARLDEGSTRKSAYDSLIARLAKLDKVDEALRLAETMARGKYGLSACSFHPILNVVTRKKRMDDAWRVVEAMRNLGAPPDMTAYNYLLSASCFSGQLDAAAEVLKTAEEEGMKADGRTYDALVLGACKAGKVEAAMVLLRRMGDDGVPPLLSTHVCVVDSLLRMGFSEQAVKFVRSFSGRDTWLETETYGILASRLIKLKRFDEAKLVLNEMISRGLVMGDRLKHQCESLL